MFAYEYAKFRVYNHLSSVRTVVYFALRSNTRPLVMLALVVAVVAAVVVAVVAAVVVAVAAAVIHHMLDVLRSYLE